MLAVDTNVVVRLLMADDARQMQQARAAFAAGPVLVLNTVLLETEWVLRSAFGLDAAQTHACLTALCELTAVELEDTDAVFDALAWLAQGMGFADALHLRQARQRGATGFVSFDKLLVRQAKRAKPAPGVTVSVP